MYRAHSITVKVTNIAITVKEAPSDTANIMIVVWCKGPVVFRNINMIAFLFRSYLQSH